MWTSAGRLARDHIGGTFWINRRLKVLQRALIADISGQTGISQRESEALVEEHLIGLRPPIYRGPLALHAAPEAVRLLGLLRKDEIPYPDEDWRSVNQLHADYVGLLGTLNTKLRTAQASLVKDIHDQMGWTESEAEAVVDRYLIGSRRSRANPTLYASPEAVALLEHEGILRRRRGPDRTIEQTTPTTPSGHFGGRGSQGR